MYQDISIARILLAVGVCFLIFSQVFGWVSFSVPDWLQFYEPASLANITSSNNNSTTVLKKFGLLQICIFSSISNDFNCAAWKGSIPTFVNLALILIPFGLGSSCLSLLFVCFGLLCRRAYSLILLFAALFAFLCFVFTIIGHTVFAVESSAYVARFRLDINESPRRWGLWLLIPELVLSFLASLCFVIASLLFWCDYRTMHVTGILNHSVDKYNGSVFKGFSDNNTTTAIKQPYPYQDYPNSCYQMNGLNNNKTQQQQMGYQPPPSYNGVVNTGYQPTPPGIFGYSRPGSPAMNQMYPYTNMDPYYPRHYMTETSEMDELPRGSRSRRRSRSHSRRQSDHRSRSNSPGASSAGGDNNQKQTQFIPIPVPYYHPQPTTVTQPTQQSKQQAPVTMLNNNPATISYMVPQTKQYNDDNLQSANKQANMLKYANLQPSLVAPNATQPVYTIAYRTNNNGNILAPNILNGSAATTYVTATRSQIADITSFTSDSDKDDDNNYQTLAKRINTKKININEAWTWRKTQ